MNKALARLISVHEECFADKAPACRPGCSVCCTDQVLITGMEGEALLEEIRRQGREDLLGRIAEAARRNIFRPATTMNELAEMCLARQEPPPEPEAEVSGCPLLEDGLCPVYEARPLACRAQVSESVCEPGGESVTDELGFTLSQVFFQAAEHLDPEGLSGNLIDMLGHLCGQAGGEHLRRNRPVPGLLVPPEHFTRARDLLKKLTEEQP